jgi:hypothetical protein
MVLEKKKEQFFVLLEWRESGYYKSGVFFNWSKKKRKEKEKSYILLNWRHYIIYVGVVVQFTDTSLIQFNGEILIIFYVKKKEEIR